MIETMSEVFHGMGIARRRIAEEAQARTGFLDLGGLGLATLPPELFRLRHLRELNLGAGIQRENGTYHKVYDSWDPSVRNNVTEAGDFENLRQLPALARLSISLTPLADLTPLAGLTALRSLECGGTQVSDLTPLMGLAALQAVSYTHLTLPTICSV